MSDEMRANLVCIVAVACFIAVMRLSQWLIP